MVFKANKVKAGMAKAPHSVTVPLYGGQIHAIRDIRELNNRARKVFSRRGKAQIPTCLFLPHRGKRCLGNKRFKLIPTIVSASETFSKLQAAIMQRKLYSYKCILTTQDSMVGRCTSIGRGSGVGMFK